MPYLTNYCKSFILEVQKALALQTASSLPEYQISKRKMTALVESRGRSFFLFVITVRNSPCNFEGDVNCSAKKREQKHDLFKRHGASPLPALKHSGENEIPNEKIRSYPVHPGYG